VGRLARILLLPADYGTEGETELDIVDICQETLAGLVGTTRSEVSISTGNAVYGQTTALLRSSLSRLMTVNP